MWLPSSGTGRESAARCVAVTERGSHTLESALKRLRAGEPLSDPVLGLLEPLREGVHENTVETLVSEVIAALDLYGKAALWPDGAQARANLLRLQAEADAVPEATRQILLAGRYYGTGPKTFLSLLAARGAAEDPQPQPRGAHKEGGAGGEAPTPAWAASQERKVLGPVP